MLVTFGFELDKLTARALHDMKLGQIALKFPVYQL